MLVIYASRVIQEQLTIWVSNLQNEHIGGLDIVMGNKGYCWKLQERIKYRKNFKNRTVNRDGIKKKVNIQRRMR